MSAAASIIYKIIRVRSRLIKLDVGGKNKAKCISIIKNLKMQIDAYGKKWNDEGWEQFLRRNRNDIEYLIPENSGGMSLKNQLYEV